MLARFGSATYALVPMHDLASREPRAARRSRLSSPGERRRRQPRLTHPSSESISGTRLLPRVWRLSARQRCRRRYELARRELHISCLATDD